MGKSKKIIEKMPKKLFKRLFGILAVCGLSFAVFSPNFCYAQTSNESQDMQEQEDFTSNVRSFINMMSQIVYVFLWPLLVVAGTALDNSLIYGKFLNLDAALWDVWNIMKNIANFALGFVFVFAIVKNLFKSSFGDGNPLQDAVKVIKSTLIAGVLVQMSWFLLGALLDLSTTLIYTVGGLPLSMLGSYSKDTASMPIMQLHTKIDENDGGGVMHYYSFGEDNFSPCYLIDNDKEQSSLKLNGFWGQYIGGREMMYLSGEDVQFKSGYCTLYGYPYKYQESQTFFTSYQASGTTTAALNADYLKKLKNYIHDLTGDTLKAELQNCFILSAYGGTTGACSGLGSIPFTGDIFDTANNKLSTLLEESKGWVGPLVTVYSSILKVQELLVNNANNSTLESLFGAIINTLFVLVLFVPLAILAVFLVIRVGFLRVVIALSPILILIRFGPEPINKLKDKDAFKKFSIESIIRRIFSPVVVVFALGLCIIFLVTIKATSPTENTGELLSSFGIQQHTCGGNGSVTDDGEGVVATGASDENCGYLVAGLVDLDISLSGFNKEKDVFVYCLMMFLSVGIVWFFMKIAIDFMGEGTKLGEKKLMDSAEKFMGNIPIVPLGSLGSVGISQIKKLTPSARLESFTNNLQTKQDAILKKRFPWAYGIEEDGSKGATETQITTIKKEIIEKITKGQTVAYKDLSDSQRNALESYYGSKTAAENVVNSIIAYNNPNTDKYVDLKKVAETMSTKTHTSADAFRISEADLNVAVKSDDAWIEWAKGMVGGAVHTKDGVRMVSVVRGTEMSAAPVYEIMKREDYERQWFGESPQNVTLDKFNEWKDSSNDEEKNKYNKMTASFDKLQKQYDEFISKDEDKLKDDELEQYQQMKKFFDENLDWLRKFNPDKFKDKKEGES